VSPAALSAEADPSQFREALPSPPGTPLPRLALLDAARGVALAAMVVFHCAFDLDTLHLAPVGIEGIGWRSFAKLIAASFLFISGVSLVIAQGKAFRPASYARRLAILVGAAALVTLGTWYAMPDAFIFFGILHSIAVASLIGLLFLKAPAPATLAAAILVFALPHYLASPAFDAPWLVWLGLGTTSPITLDFEPVFPWLAPFLAGMAVAQFALARFARSAVAHWQPRLWPGRALAFAGRHSLIIYLVHQPLMFGTLSLVAQGLASSVAIPPEDRPFVENCQQVCLERHGTQSGCLTYCVCTAGELKKAGLWENVLTDRYTPEVRQRLATAMQVCAKAR
jgi:uncharacterized membrane protein